MSQGHQGLGAGWGETEAHPAATAQLRPPQGASEQAGGWAVAGSTGHWATAPHTACHFLLAYFTGEGMEAQFPAQGHMAAGGRTGSQPVCPGVGTPPLAPRAEVP